MAELRFNPLLNDWVIISAARQGRPQMPENWCPFCPGSGKVPDDYVVLRYLNDFPALSQQPPKPDDVATEFFRVKPTYGRCEVILYSPDHHATLPNLSDATVFALANLWREAFEDIRRDPKIKYIMIFENRGELVGVTMPHPHGQIYGYSELPKKLELELDSANEYFEKNGGCLFCRMLAEEQAAGKRVIFENEHFAVVLPFFVEYPYGVYLYAKRHYASIGDMTSGELKALGLTVREIAGTLDTLFGFAFPYMMCMHNAPVNMGDYSDSWHFHIEFFSPLRTKNQVKYNASSETGAWAHCNPTCPEEKAEELKAAHARWLSAHAKTE